MKKGEQQFFVKRFDKKLATEKSLSFFFQKQKPTTTVQLKSGSGQQCFDKNKNENEK